MLTITITLTVMGKVGFYDVDDRFSSSVITGGNNWGHCRNLHVGVPGYRPPKVISTHFFRLVTDSATTFPQSTFEGKTR